MLNNQDEVVFSEELSMHNIGLHCELHVPCWACTKWDHVMQGVFAAAKASAPAIVFIDEVDALAPAREEDNDPHSVSETSTAAASRFRMKIWPAGIEQEEIALDAFLN